MLTAWLVLRSLRPHLADWPVARWAVAGAVLIDLDHIPLYLTNGDFAVDGGRPPTHSLLLAFALLMAGVVRPWRRTAMGLSVGALLHFARDVATGPGVPLTWPFHTEAWSVPYPAYAVAITMVAGLGVLHPRATPGELTGPVSAAGAPTTRTTPD